MSKERLEEIEKQIDWMVLKPSQVNAISQILDYAEEQAELAQYFANKNAELNKFLNKYSEAKHWGKNVIDVAMDIITKQAERVQELEEEIATHAPHGRNYTNEQYVGLRMENKRYREVVAQAISDLENECLWDALVKLKALEESD